MISLKESSYSFSKKIEELFETEEIHIPIRLTATWLAQRSKFRFRLMHQGGRFSVLPDIVFVVRHADPSIPKP